MSAYRRLNKLKVIECDCQAYSGDNLNKLNKPVTRIFVDLFSNFRGGGGVAYLCHTFWTYLKADLFNTTPKLSYYFS